MANIGFIGLGIMGQSMCENVLKKTNEQVYVFDLIKNKVNKMTEIGARAVPSIAEVGKLADRIIVMVPTGNDVRGVISDLLPVLTRGKIVIDMSTIEPVVSRELAISVKKTGAEMIDAPVVKSKGAAIAGELGIYVGGSKKVYYEVKELLGYMGSNIIHLGDNGSGLVMKICHNVLVAEIQNGVNEMLTLVETAGLEIEKAIKAISYGGGQNFYLDDKADSIKNHDFSPKFTIKNMNKDLHIAALLVEEMGLELPGMANTAKIYECAMDQKMAGEDFSATIKVVKKCCQVNHE